MAFAIERGTGSTIRRRETGLGGRSAFHLANAFFHLFARLERNDELLWYKDFIAGSRVASLASGPSFYLKNAEIPQFDAVIFDQRFNDGVERLLDDLFRLKLCQTDLLGDGFDNLFLGHVAIPSKRRPLARNNAQKAVLLMSQV